MSTPYPKTIALMRELGVDPIGIAENEFDTSGYWEIITDNDGKHILDRNGDAIAIRHRWPSPEIALRVVDQFVKERLAAKR